MVDKEVVQPNWATHKVKILVPNSNYPDKAKSKWFWFKDTGYVVHVQLADSVGMGVFPPPVRKMEGTQAKWWRDNVREKVDLEPKPFIGQLSDRNAIIDQYKTLADLLELEPDELKQWLTDHQQDVTVVPRQLNKRLRDAFTEANEAFHDGEEVEGSPDDEWAAIIEEWEHGEKES